MESNAAKPLNILIVEDDVGDAKLLHRLLCQSALLYLICKMCGTS